MQSIVHQLISQTNPQWHEILAQAFELVEREYLDKVFLESDFLPGKENMLAAFNQPLETVRYVLLGESPYPRRESANGYAFWDNSIQSLWSEKGLSKTVNRATSMRNLIKMMLHARGDLNDDFSQQAIAILNKTPYWQTNSELFSSLINKGFLLLNASLVFRAGLVHYDARQWQAFLNNVLCQLAAKKANIQLILFGRIAAQIDRHDLEVGLIAEHPYNISFMTNPDVLNFFQPLNLLACDENKY